MNECLDIQDVSKHLIGLQFSLADYLKKYIAKNDISLRQIASLSGLSKSTIEYHLSGESDNNLGKLLLIAQHLGLSGNICINLSEPQNRDNNDDS